MLSNPESQPFERALALSWVMHIMGDIHQPLHVSDLMSKDFPSGNAAGTLAYVWDPLADSAMPLHILCDSNTRRSTELEDVDGYAQEIMEMFPRTPCQNYRPFRDRSRFGSGRWKATRWRKTGHTILTLCQTPTWMRTRIG